MLDREACERRVYRLATLLTGNPVAAAGVIAQVVDAQPDLRRLDGPHMDRLTVLRSREIRPATLVDDDVPVALAEALASLTPQQREAWVLGEVYRTPIREAAKAMDCSVTANERHLEQAKAEMALRTGTSSQAAAPLLAYSMKLDVPQFYRAAQRRTRRTRQLLKAFIATIIVLAGLLLVRWLLQQRQAVEPGLIPPSSDGIVGSDEPSHSAEPLDDSR